MAATGDEVSDAGGVQAATGTAPGGGAAGSPVRFVGIAGNIGSGKSTLVEFLQRRFGIRPFYEPFDRNPFLSDFYGDMPRWAFHSQVWFLASKFRLHRNIEAALERGERVLVQDRTIYEDAEIFAELLFRSRRIARREYATYRLLYESVVDLLPPPDLLIYLRCSVRTLRRRIRKRGRQEEMSIPYRYLRRLNDRYEEWFASYDRGDKMAIDSDKLLYLDDLFDQVELIERVSRILERSRRG